MKIEDLRRGMLVRHRGTWGKGETYVVDTCYGSRATAVRTVDITNPDEWEIVSETAEAPITGSGMSLTATASMTLSQAQEIADLRERVARLEQELKYAPVGERVL